MKKSIISALFVIPQLILAQTVTSSNGLRAGDELCRTIVWLPESQPDGERQKMRCCRISPNIKMLSDCLKIILIFIGILCLHSCSKHKKQYVCLDNYLIRNVGDSMIIIRLEKNIWNDNVIQDTTILHLENGQYILDDGSLLFSIKSDTFYTRKPIYYLQEEKQIINIKREDGINYSTIQTYYPEDYGKRSTVKSALSKKGIANDTWKKVSSITFFYDNNYKIVKILQDGAWLFPEKPHYLSHENTLRNKDTICIYRNADDMIIVNLHHQYDESTTTDTLQLHYSKGEYLTEDNYLFLSSFRDTTYIGYTKNSKGKQFQMVIGNNKADGKELFNYFYSIYWNVIKGDDKCNKYAVPIGIAKDLDDSKIIPTNENRSLLYDSDYNIKGIICGSLNFSPQ